MDTVELRFGSLGRAQILFLKLHHDRDRDRGFLMFSYNVEKGKPNLRVFLVSHDCDSLKPMKSVPLPQINFGEMGCLFHIQGKKFGLALVRPKRNCCGDYNGKVRVAVITYEYQVITTHDDHDEPSSLEDVNYKLLSTCYLEYVPWRLSYSSDLVGAYVL
ncbi:hypothetical protein M0R45_018556 [Rubus argutus]|uniref:Uncharacterized protein n=1 Tax=Rubus argutus TaxID=59490 RepID=A0AAW1X3S6_RUBAR